MGTNGNTLPAKPQVHLAGPEDTRLSFSGPPGSLTGDIPLVNHSSERQKIRSVAVKSDELRGAAGLPISKIPFYARLEGGDQMSVPATLALDPKTPPGSYDLELTVGNRTMAATAHVSEVVDVRVDPLEITILAGPETSYTRTVVVENAGNVRLPGGTQCETPIFDSFDLVSALLIGLKKGDRKSAESMTRAFLNEWADLNAGTLVTKRKNVVVAPGQKVAVDLEFQLPAELKPLRHYQANLQLYNAVLSLHIYTTVSMGSNGKTNNKKKEGSPNGG